MHILQISDFSFKIQSADGIGALAVLGREETRGKGQVAPGCQNPLKYPFLVLCQL